MDHTNEIKKLEELRYIESLAQEEEAEASGCCGGGGCGCSSDTGQDENLPGYELALGAGLPAEFIPLKEGDVVVDLGSGSGNDTFYAREKVGISGKVIGIENNELLIERARQQADMAGYNNVEFRPGLVENPPVGDEIAKAVTGNGLLSNTVDKERVLHEAYRIVKHHGHLSFCEIVTDGEVPQGLRMDAEMYLGCPAGAMDAQSLLNLLVDVGFENVMITDMRPVILPEAMLYCHLNDEQVTQYQNSDFGFYSMTVVAEKPCCKSGKSEEEIAVMEHDHSACACGGEHCGGH